MPIFISRVRELRGKDRREVFGSDGVRWHRGSAHDISRTCNQRRLHGKRLHHAHCPGKIGLSPRSPASQNDRLLGRLSRFACQHSFIGLFMKLGYESGFSFSLAQAFTPGNTESNRFSQPPSRGLPNREAGKPPGRGLHSVWAFSNPGVNAWATEKTAFRMFRAGCFMNNPGSALPEMNPKRRSQLTRLVEKPYNGRCGFPDTNGLKSLRILISGQPNAAGANQPWQ